MCVHVSSAEERIFVCNSVCVCVRRLLNGRVCLHVREHIHVCPTGGDGVCVSVCALADL